MVHHVFHVLVQSKPRALQAKITQSHDSHKIAVKMNVDRDDVRQLARLNFEAPMMLTRDVVPHMIERGRGHIVNIASLQSYRAFPNGIAYGASKAAVRPFDEALAREARRAKVRVIDARPPHTETGLAGRAIEGQAPKMPAGLTADRVADVIVAAIDGDVADLPSEAFG